MAREELKWQNIDADDLPAEVKKSFDAMVEAEAAFKADLEKLLKNEGHMPEDKFLVMSRKGKRFGVAYASTPRGEGSRVPEVQNQMSGRQWRHVDGERLGGREINDHVEFCRLPRQAARPVSYLAEVHISNGVSGKYRGESTNLSLTIF